MTAPSIEDYGVGWSNLKRLLNLPVDGLKIDRKIAASVVDRQEAAAMVTATVNLAKELDLAVVADGIENEKVRDRLAEAGCDWGQGWFYSPAAASDQVRPLLERMEATRATDRSAPRRWRRSWADRGLAAGRRGHAVTGL